MTLKISILGSRGIPARYGGFETAAEHLSVGLAEKGHDVTVYCPTYQKYREPTYRGVRLRFVPNLEHRFKARVPRAICNLLYDILSLLAACFSQTQVIYMLGYASGPFLILPRLFGKKLVVNPDGLEWKSTRWGLAARSWLYLCEFLSARCSNTLVGDAEPISDRFRRVYNVSIATIEYGTELCRPAPDVQPELPRASYYIAVARMVPETKIDVIIDGFRQAGLRDRKLLVVGPVTDKTFFESEILTRIDGENVCYMGAIYDKPRLKNLRAHARALLHGHASDGTNPSLLESMGCASPVISINRESNAKVLTRDNALYFTDALTLADALAAFEDMNDEGRRRMGERNYERVAKDFSWSAAVDAHEAVFQSVCRD